MRISNGQVFQSFGSSPWPRFMTEHFWPMVLWWLSAIIERVLLLMPEDCTFLTFTVHFATESHSSFRKSTNRYVINNGSVPSQIREFSVPVEEVSPPDWIEISSYRIGSRCLSRFPSGFYGFYGFYGAFNLCCRRRIFFKEFKFLKITFDYCGVRLESKWLNYNKLRKHISNAYLHSSERSSHFTRAGARALSNLMNIVHVSRKYRSLYCIIE